MATTAANLVFSEPPQLTADAPAVQERLDQLVEDALYTLLRHAAEANSALGDLYLWPVIDAEILPGRAFLAAVHADGAIPLIRWAASSGSPSGRRCWSTATPTCRHCRVPRHTDD